MYFLIQLLLAVVAIYSGLNFTGDMRLYVPLGCLIAMFIVGRLDTARFEKRETRKSFLKSEMEKIFKKEASGIKEQDLFTMNSLLCPKGELVLTDAVHSIFKDLGFSVAVGGKYSSVDRIVRIPDTQFCFGLEILTSEGEVEKDHPKIKRALQFAEEKKRNEKTLIIASTHVHQPISERERLNEISTELRDFIFFPAQHDDHKPKLRADRDRPFKKLPDLFRSSIGDNIVISSHFQHVFKQRRN